MSEVKLKKCPFCGGEAEIQAGKKVMYWEQIVVCAECGASIKHHECYVPSENRKKAIKVWNTRKPVDEVLERLDDWKKEFKGIKVDYAEGLTDGFLKAIKIVKEVMGYE